MNNVVHGQSYSFFKDWLCKMHNWDLSKELPDGYVRQTTYWLMNNETPIGICRLRHQLTESSREYGGSFGYAISPKFRKMGYGTTLVSLILTEAQKFNINEIIAMVSRDNVASNKIMIKNKGRLVRQNQLYNFYLF